MARDRFLDIAVTGVAGRFPHAPDLATWWTALQTGRVLTTRFERSELRAAGVPESLLDDPDYVPVRGRLPDADRFDHTLFGVTPREAELMDPQHRLMLEVAWTALEDAAVSPLGAAPTTGVFASASGSGYLRAMVASGTLDPLTLEDAIHGTEPDFMASLIAYRLGLTGPAVAVQTACSSSLVAVHLAVQALLNGDCDQALVVAAGIAYPQAGHLHVPGGVHSASGRCRPFDAAADGVVAGSGVACVVLRRLADALRDGPEAYGVLLGTAINNDGAVKVGYYAPSVAGQEAVIRAALCAADVDASTIGYLETHGTGTRIGDPIEWSAASAALSGMGARVGQVAVGTLKANVGHLDNAAGLASLIKALLVVRDGVLPPVAGFTALNPLLKSDASPLYVPTEAGPWSGPEPRRAGVSSFGIGGTNVHVIVERAPRLTGSAADDGARDGGEAGHLLLLSAAEPEALARSAARLGEHLTERHQLDLADVSFTLAVGRAALPARLAVAADTAAEAGDRLATGAGVVRGARPGSGAAPAVFAFPGQGGAYPGMAIPFAAALPGFPAALDAALAAFAPALAARLRGALLEPDGTGEELAETELAQPALFALEYAATVALSRLGLTPAAVIGHSLGEITAATVAGVLDLADAARFVTARGRAMQGCPPGAMLALGCAEARALELVAAAGLDLELAAVNSPDSCVLAGSAEDVAACAARVADLVPTHRLRVHRAFHSALIEPALPPLTRELDRITVRRPALPLATATTGRIIPVGAELAPGMFVEQARRPVRFAEALDAVASRFPDPVLVEVGPGRVLSALADAAGLTVVPLSPARTARPAAELLTALGTLWTLGQPLDPVALCGRGRRLHLPGYVFAGRRWLAPEAAPASGEGVRRVPASHSGAPASSVPGPERSADGPGSLSEPTPTLEVSALLTQVWTELLGHADLTESSDFFQLGGDSLLVTHLARRVRTELGVRIPLRDLLLGRTLGRQTTLVRELLDQAATATGAGVS